MTTGSVTFDQPFPNISLLPSPWQPPLCTLFQRVWLFRFHRQVISWSICLSLSTYFSWHNALRIYPCCCERQGFLPFLSMKNLYLCFSICLHLSISRFLQWTFRLFLCLDYCQFCCSGREYRYLFELLTSFPLDIYPDTQKWIFWIMRWFYF